jgi:hypothetical protein
MGNEERAASYGWVWVAWHTELFLAVLASKRVRRAAPALKGCAFAVKPNAWCRISPSWLPQSTGKTPYLSHIDEKFEATPIP